MIIVTSDYNIIRSMDPQSFVLMVVGEDFNPSFGGTDALVNLTNALPSSEIVYEYLNDLPLFGYQKATNSAIVQYEDYLLSNNIVNETLMMLPIVGLNKHIIIYLSQNDMENKEFPFVEILINYIRNMLMIPFRRDVNTNLIELDFSPFSAIDTALKLLKVNRISLEKTISIINLYNTRIEPNLEQSLLIEKFGNNFNKLGESQAIYISKRILIDKLLGKLVEPSLIPAFTW